MTDASELLATVEAVIVALRRQGITYFITGSFASSVHGEFRATRDLDVVAALERRHLAPLAAELSGEFFVDLEQAKTAVASGKSFNLIHRTSYLKVDIFPCATAFDREVARRAVEIVVPGGREPLRVASKEDILLAKLRWYALSDETSEMQRRDIQGLVALNRETLDRRYLDRWAESLGVRDLLERFIAAG